MERLKKRHTLFLISYTVLLTYAIFNFEKLHSFFSFILTMLSPLIYGLVFAFLIGLVADKFKLLLSKTRMSSKVNHVISVILAYLIIFAAIIGFLFLVVPQVLQSVKEIVYRIPQFITSFQQFMNELTIRFDLNAEILRNINTSITSWLNDAFTYLSTKLPEIINYTFNIMNIIKDVLFGLVISVYVVFTKEALVKQCKKTVTVLIPEKPAVKTIEVMHTANLVFRQYVAGQITVSIILGVMTFLCMWIFKMPYALLNSTIICLTNLVPIVGPIFGAIPTTLIVMMIDPIQGIWFLIMVIILQQIESNIISPKIIGDSVGISGLWVMIAIIVGGGLFGVSGMIVAVPVMAVIYQLFADFINSRYDPKYNTIIQRHHQE